MLKRIFVPVALFAFLFGAASWAQPVAPGAGYLPITPPQPTTGAGKVEVVEVFSYGCIHCAQFQPYVDAWHKKADKNAVHFVYVPATFNNQYKVLARGFFAADSLKVVPATHQRVFNALFIDGKRVQTIEDLASIYASFGVKKEDFLKASKSFYVESQLKRADDLMRGYRIDGTPTVIVAGKYRVTAESAGGPDKVFSVVDRLVAQERQKVKTAPKMQ